MEEEEDEVKGKEGPPTRREPLWRGRAKKLAWRRRRMRRRIKWMRRKEKRDGERGVTSEKWMEVEGATIEDEGSWISLEEKNKEK